MFIRNFINTLAAMMLLSAPVHAADNKTIYIDIVGEGRFEVIYHRATSNATGAAIAGVIGAGIQSGIEAGRDEEKARQLGELIEKEAWKTQFLDTLNDKLKAEGYEAVWTGDTRDLGAGAVLKIYPEYYGFRMIDTTTRLVSAFISFKAAFMAGNSTNKAKPEKESYYITHKNQYPWDDLLTKGSAVNSDLEAVLEKAANRLANKIIYSQKE